MLKRSMDIILAAGSLILFLPLMCLIAVLIKIDSRGSVFFVQNRLGRYCSVFPMIKFRTMHVGAENTGTGLFSYQDDPRVTRVGKYLRLLSLDEIPQLINVFLGHMSLVGPRPPVTYELGNYRDFSPKTKVRFRVKPGITGLAQVAGRNALDWDIKIVLDNEYVVLSKRYGILLDIKILIMTVFVVFSFQNVIEAKK